LYNLFDKLSIYDYNRLEFAVLVFLRSLLKSVKFTWHLFLLYNKEMSNRDEKDVLTEYFPGEKHINSSKIRLKKD